MKSLVFDAGPVISLATNNLLWLLEKLKKKFDGEFYISKSAKEEVVEHPLATKKFKFEALQILKIIDDNVLNVVDNKNIDEKKNTLFNLANSIFYAYNNNIHLVHRAEMAGISLCIERNADAFVVDERTSRLLIEDYKSLKELLEKKLHTKIMINKESLLDFQKIVKGIKMIRSVELVTAAYELGLLNDFILNVKDPKTTLLEGVLWGVKLNGCAVSRNEINEIISLVK